MTPTLADEIEALAKEATPGPWVVAGQSYRHAVAELDHGPVFIMQDNMDLHSKPPVWPKNICEVSEANKVENFVKRTHDEQLSDAALIVALVNNLPTIVSALREVSALKEEVERLRGAVSHADRCQRFVKLVASQRLSEQALAWYGDEFGEDGEPDFEGAYDAFIEQARSIINDHRAVLGGGG